MYVKLFAHKCLGNLQSFNFVFKITISKMRNLVALSLKLAQSMETYLVNGILVYKSNGLMIKCLMNK